LHHLLVTCVAWPLITPQFVSPVNALETVSLQLKWKHRFQFAGYYAAIEKGFYRYNGFDVELREGNADTDAGATVATGPTNFGVCTTSVLLDPLQRANNVVLGVIFQRSASMKQYDVLHAFPRDPLAKSLLSMCSVAAAA
jgi:ABC-type nitrate/sulfonate/bicarbonate transport system substrate-binding protein